MLIYGLKVTLLGVGVVFIALSCLMVIVYLQSKVLLLRLSKQEVLLADGATKGIKLALASEELQENNDEIAVVIAAAIVASGKKVVVKNITRIYGNQVSPWVKSSRTTAISTGKL